jgi:hypothetical protein
MSTPESAPQHRPAILTEIDVYSTGTGFAPEDLAILQRFKEPSVGLYGFEGPVAVLEVAERACTDGSVKCNAIWLGCETRESAIIYITGAQEVDMVLTERHIIANPYYMDV